MLGVAPRILSGAEEAEVTFVGTLSGLELDGGVTVFDVGGGSTEVDPWPRRGRTRAPTPR